MTAKNWIKKFPGRKPKGDSSLEDMACPKCGWRKDFEIEITSTVTVDDEGVMNANDCDHTWDDKSPCECGNRRCFHSGKVKDFRIPGLDAALEDLGQESDEVSKQYLAEMEQEIKERP